MVEENLQTGSFEVVLERMNDDEIDESVHTVDPNDLVSLTRRDRDTTEEPSRNCGDSQVSFDRS